MGAAEDREARWRRQQEQRSRPSANELGEILEPTQAKEGGCSGRSWNGREGPVWEQGRQGHLPRGDGGNQLFPGRVKMGKAGGSKGKEEGLCESRNSTEDLG